LLKTKFTKAADFQENSAIYVDDFEGSSQQLICNLPMPEFVFTQIEMLGNYDFNANANDLSYGFKRAKLSWYSIDPLFYTSKPSGITNDDLSLNTTRRILSLSCIH
jgi:cell surface protein SprA